MVERDIAGRGIEDEGVLEAMRTVPRERFVPERLAAQAYSDQPLPIGSGQTISQPYVVAVMSAAAQLTPGDRVLEVGTGSGYGAAILGQIVIEVWTIERHQKLASRAERVLRDLGYENVHVVCGDGTLGWPDAAPYDAVIVTAGGPAVPEVLRSQLDERGRLVMPVGPDRHHQDLVREQQVDGVLRVDQLGMVRFVPLVGEHGWE